MCLVKDSVPDSGIGGQFGQLSLDSRASFGIRKDDHCDEFAVVFQFEDLSHRRQPLESSAELWSRSAVSGYTNKRLLEAQLRLVDEKPPTDGRAPRRRDGRTSSWAALLLVRRDLKVRRGGTACSARCDLESEAAQEFVCAGIGVTAQACSDKGEDPCRALSERNGSGGFPGHAPL
jgi:hypothetical protein